MSHTTGGRTETDVAQQSDNDCKYNLKDEWLLIIIDIDNGLLDLLKSEDVLSERQIELIQSKSTQTDCITQLLDDVTKLSTEQKEKFLSALDQTQQSHVANYIRNDGRRPTTDPDNWPIAQNGEHVKIRQQWGKLVDLIDSRNGLLDELFSAECISDRQMTSLDAEKDDVKRNDKLLRTIRRLSVTNYREFMQCLRRTKQHHVFSLLESNGASDCEPLTEQQKKSLRKNYSTLVQSMELKDGLLSTLFANDCITKLQMDFVGSFTNAAESNRRLLDMILRGSRQDYDKFVECLRETQQHHLSSLLLGDGVVAQVIAKTSGCCSSHLKQQERLVVEQFKSAVSQASPENKRHMFEKLREYEKELNQQDIELIAMQTEHSVKLFFVCHSLNGLLQLNKLFVDGKLRKIIQQLFNELQGNRQLINVERLTWKMSDYSHVAHHLFQQHSLPANSLVYQLAQESSYVATDPPTVSVLPLDQLPHELVEHIVINATGRLFATIRNRTPRADVHTMTLLSSVCFHWWDTLTYRLKNKLLLKTYLRRICAPYRFNPKLAASLRVARSNSMSVAELHNKVYIVCTEENTLQVLTLFPANYGELAQQLAIPDLRKPGDIVACSENNCLYISDATSCCIWQVNLTSFPLTLKTVDRFISTLEYVPWTLSLRSNQLLVTSYSGSALYVYDVSGSGGQLVRQIQFAPNNMLARHAVLTADDNAIVCPTINWWNEDAETAPTVGKVSGQGHVRRAYSSGALAFHRPNYVTTDGQDHILVSDPDNKQIIHLNSDLEIQQVLITQLAGNPRRLCYSSQTGRLYICYYSSAEIHVYNVRSPSSK